VLFPRVTSQMSALCSCLPHFCPGRCNWSSFRRTARPRHLNPRSAHMHTSPFTLPIEYPDRFTGRVCRIDLCTRACHIDIFLLPHCPCSAGRINGHAACSWLMCTLTFYHVLGTHLKSSFRCKKSCRLLCVCRMCCSRCYSVA